MLSWLIVFRSIELNKVKEGRNESSQETIACCFCAADDFWKCKCFGFDSGKHQFFHTIANNVNLHLNLGNKNIASKFCVMFMTTPLPDPDANNHRQRLYNLCSIAVWNSLGSPRGGSGAPVMIPLFRLTF